MNYHYKEIIKQNLIAILITSFIPLLGSLFVVTTIFLSIQLKRYVLPFELYREGKKYWKERRSSKKKVVEEEKEVINYPFSTTLNLGNKNHQINWRDIDRHFLILGGSGAGKSFSWILPYTAKVVKDRSTVLFDYDYPSLSTHYEALTNGKARYLNFSDVTKSVRVNPIAPRYLPSVAAARDIAEVIVLNLNPDPKERGSFWQTSSVAYLTGVIWYFRNNYPSKCYLPHVISSILNVSYSVMLEKISTDIEVQGIVSSISTAVENESGNQLSGVIGNLQNALSKLYTKELFYLLSEDEMDLDISAGHNHFCIASDPKLIDVYSPVISLIMTICMKNMNMKDKHPSALIIDEGSTLLLPSLERCLATCRKHKMSIFFSVQDISQLKTKYGENPTSQLLANFNNQIFGKVNEPKTAEYCSKMFGKVYREFESFSNSTSTSGPKLGDILGKAAGDL